MATKDYVRRPQKRKPKKAQSNTVPWMRILVAVLLIAGFIFALYKLQQSPPRDNATNTSSSLDVDSVNSQNQTLLEEGLNQANGLPQTNTSRSSDDVEPLGPLPEALSPLPVLEEEDWEYIDALPEFSVEVDATGPIESDKVYSMPCGSFREVERAERLKAQIALQGLESRIIPSDNENGRWYRVVLGPYQSKRNAQKDVHQLRSGGINGCKIR